MNDETALKLRTLKDSSGNYLWNHSDGTIMDELQERQRELKATAGRFAEVKYWMDAFKEHVHSGEKMDTTDAVMLRQFTDKIVVYDDRLGIHLRIGGTLEKNICK